MWVEEGRIAIGEAGAVANLREEKGPRDLDQDGV